MSPLFGPILAQIVTLGAADRTEARYVTSDVSYAEVASTPRATVDVAGRHGDLTLAYAPALTITPLDEPATRRLLVLHTGLLAASYRWARTMVTLSEVGSKGEVNFREQALAGPAPTIAPANTGAGGGAAPGTTSPVGATGGPTVPGGTAGMGTPGTGTGTGTSTTPAAFRASRALGNVVPFVSSSTDLTLTNSLSQASSLLFGIGYFIAGSVGKNASPDYPLVKGPRAQASFKYQPSHRDTLTSSLSSQYAQAATHNNALITLATENWAHAIDRHTTTTLGGGLSVSRNSRADGYRAYDIFPTFTGGILHNRHVARGLLALSSTLSAAPVIDPVQAYADPRFSVAESVGWSKSGFSTSLVASTAISLNDPNSTGALNSFSGAFMVGYRIATALLIDSGVRGFWQSFQGSTTVPPTYATFVGLTFGAQQALNH